MIISGILINEIVIDDHYQMKHSAHMNDELILLLMKSLNLEELRVDQQSSCYQYFTTESIHADGKQYRLILVMEDGESYIGVVNAFRR